jgi:hypothetical protein
VSMRVCNHFCMHHFILSVSKISIVDNGGLWKGALHLENLLIRIPSMLDYLTATKYDRKTWI